MRAILLLLCLSVPAFCYNGYRSENYDSPLSQARYSEQRLQQNRGQQQLNDYGYDNALHQRYDDQRQQRGQQHLNGFGYAYDSAQARYGEQGPRPNNGIQQLNDFGYTYDSAQGRYGEQGPRPIKGLHQRPLPLMRQRMKDADVLNVLQFVQSVTNDANREALRSGEPVDIKVEAVNNDDKHLELEVEGNIVAKMEASLPTSKTTLRQMQLSGMDTTLKLAGINEIIVPGTGPAIQLSVEGPLADKIVNMKFSDLMLPPGMKQEMLSGVYQKKLQAMQQLSTGR